MHLFHSLYWGSVCVIFAKVLVKLEICFLTVLSHLVLWRNAIQGDKNLWTFQVGSAVSNTQNVIHFFGSVLAESSCLQAKYHSADFVEAAKKGLALGNGISHLLHLPRTCIPYILVGGVEKNCFINLPNDSVPESQRRVFTRRMPFSVNCA